MTYLPLLGLPLIAAGFLLRVNPLLTVLVAALATGVAAGLGPLATLAAFGHAYNENRFVTVIYLVLPVIGTLERYGLQARAAALVGRLRGLTVGRLLIGYLALRQLSAALGLTSIAGQVQTVRPLIAPMAAAAAGEDGDGLRAMTAATDNVGLLFGEDVFIAIGSILLMKATLQGLGIGLAPFQLSVWAIPTALAAFAIHAFRLWRLDRRRA